MQFLTLAQKSNATKIASTHNCLDTLFILKLTAGKILIFSFAAGAEPELCAAFVFYPTL